ncbi:hypothetical protein RHMOL_Rhmol09G0064500 [Rhododendron molle]|uniref:Uncharacterized protein n=1 Tax=Rhododendron molle TaxID=49168 RepID=A0ACC0MC52_RHOML|nr:hypothetical protein RHMOL_Rhmol09G0064500 [Rhododendron molle]
MGIWEGLLRVVHAMVSVIGAIGQPIVEDVVNRSVDALYGFVSRELGGLWRLAYRKKPQAAPILLDQGRAVNMKLSFLLSLTISTICF